MKKVTRKWIEQMESLVSDKHSDLNQQIAMAIFGWRWLAYNGIPVRDTPGYPQRQMVRMFLPPDKELHKTWKTFIKDENAAPATGKEPLDYSYCSSRGVHVWPMPANSETDCKRMESEIWNRKKWQEYKDRLVEMAGTDIPTELIPPIVRCRAALDLFKMEAK